MIKKNRERDRKQTSVLELLYHSFHFDRFLGPSMNCAVKQLRTLLSRLGLCLDVEGKKTSAVEREAAALRGLSVIVHMAAHNVVQTVKKISKFGKVCLGGHAGAK